MLFRNKGTTRKLSKLIALTFALNCVTYTATPLANLSISGQIQQEKQMGLGDIHVNVPQVFGFGKASAATYYQTIGPDNTYDEDKYVATDNVECSDGSGTSINDAIWIIDKEHYAEGVNEICQTMKRDDSTSDATESATATSSTSTSSPKTTYTSSITYSTGNSNQATVNANLLLDSLGKMANGSSNAGRTYSQEEMDLAYVRAYQNTGVTAQTIEQTKANIEQAEAEAEENGTEVPMAVKAMKAIVEQYNDVVDRVTGGNSILGDNPVTLEQLAVLRTALKTEQIKSDTECQNKRVEDENATCELSAKGKEYASLLSYLEAQQVNQTTGSTKTTNATNTGTQNTSTTVNTAYGNVNGGNSTISNGSSSNSGSGASSYVTTASGSTVSCNGGVYISSANTCCPSDKPVYNNGKCYASTSESSSSSSSSDDDYNNKIMMLMMMMGMNKNGDGTCVRNPNVNYVVDPCTTTSGNTSGVQQGTQTRKDNTWNTQVVPEARGSKIQTKLYPYPKDSIQQMGEAEKLIVGYQADQRLNLKDENGNSITPTVIVTVPTHYKDANGNDRFMEYKVKGEVGKEIVVLPDTSNSMYYKLQGVPGEAYRKMNEKDSSGNLIPWLMKIEVFNPKTNKQIGTGFINYYVVSMTTSILNDPEKLEWDVQSVSEAEDALAKLSHSFEGTIEGAMYDDANGLCILQTKGAVVSNYDSSIYGTEKLEGYTKVATAKVDKKGCESLDASGKKVVFDDIRAMKDVNGSDASYFTDNGNIKIGDGNETVSYLKESSLIEEFTTSVESSDGDGMILDPKLIYDKDGNLQIAENKTYNGERQLCKDVPTCRAYVEEKLNRKIEDITFKLDENGIPKAYDLEGNYIGAGNESGFTKQITSNQIVPNEHLDQIKYRIQNYSGGELSTGAEHVISLNTRGISIGDISGAQQENLASVETISNTNILDYAKQKATDFGVGVQKVAQGLTNSNVETKVNYSFDSYSHLPISLPSIKIEAKANTPSNASQEEKAKADEEAFAINRIGGKLTEVSDTVRSIGGLQIEDTLENNKQVNLDDDNLDALMTQL